MPVVTITPYPWIQDIVALLITFAAALLWLAHRTHRGVEVGLLERALTSTGLTLHRMSDALSHAHTGHLHRNLLWATIALAILVGLAFAVTHL